MAEHKAELAGVAVGLLVGAGCGLAIGWTGVGAVACGALAGAAGAAVTGAMQGKSGTDLLLDVAVGALGGALFGGAGSVIAAGLGRAVGGLVTRSGIKAALGAGFKAGRAETTAIATGLADLARTGGRSLGGAARSLGSGLADDAANLGRGLGGRLKNLFSQPCRNSFAAGTGVLLANGNVVAIENLHLGDQILATNPSNGHTGAKPITKRHLTRDHQLTDLTVTITTHTTPSGTAPAITRTTKVIYTTPEHPFWDTTTATWTNAGQLTTGHRLHTNTPHTTITVTAVHNHTNTAPMYNLTTADHHTYYVLAGNTPVLVHNCNDVTVSPMASDWATKGAHVNVGGNEVRVFPTAGGGIGAEPIRLRTGTATDKQVQTVLDCIASCPALPQDLTAKAGAAMVEMNSHNWGNALNRAAEMNFLIKALAKLE
jgi:hypothetical protein